MHFRLSKKPVVTAREGKILPAFWLGYTGGTLLWQSTGECAWHFSIGIIITGVSGI